MLATASRRFCKGSIAIGAADDPKADAAALFFDAEASIGLIDRLPVVVGTVSGHKDGFGFLVPDDGGDDLFLPYREMRMLMHGDRAAARVTGRDERGRAEGAVVAVLARRTKQVAGRFSLEGGVGFVVSHADVLVDRGEERFPDRFVH